MTHRASPRPVIMAEAIKRAIIADKSPTGRRVAHDCCSGIKCHGRLSTNARRLIAEMKASGKA